MNNQPPFGQPQQLKMNIDINTLENLSCDCGTNAFVDIKSMKILPSLLSPDGKPGFVETAIGKMCTNCKKMYSTQNILQFLREREKEKESKLIIPGR